MPDVTVLDSFMQHEDCGAGRPFVFLHGNPTSSHLWRNVTPLVSDVGRCLAPDLIGMGQSGKPDCAYTYADQARYLDAWFVEMCLDDVVLVGIDWGGVLAMDWAARHPERVAGLVMLETMVRPMTWDDFPPAARSRFEALRTPGVGEVMVLDDNAFIEESLIRTMLGELTEADHDIYRAPFTERESRVPMLQWARSMPINGEPTDVVARIEHFDTWLADSTTVPKLLLTFDGSPTLMIDPAATAWCQANIANLDTEYCGSAGHLSPEDQPEQIAAAIRAWANNRGLAPTA